MSSQLSSPSGTVHLTHTAGTFHVSRRDRMEITLEEARSFCEPFGTLEKVEFMLDQFRLALRLPKTAVVVTFSLLRIHRDMAVSSSCYLPASPI